MSVPYAYKSTSLKELRAPAESLHMGFLGEEHGVGRCEPGSGPAIGERLELIPSHICTGSNLFDLAYGVRDGRLDEELPVAARGKVH